MKTVNMIEWRKSPSEPARVRRVREPLRKFVDRNKNQIVCKIGSPMPFYHSERNDEMSRLMSAAEFFADAPSVPAPAIRRERVRSVNTPSKRHEELVMEVFKVNRRSARRIIADRRKVLDERKSERWQQH